AFDAGAAGGVKRSRLCLRSFRRTGGARGDVLSGLVVPRARRGSGAARAGRVCKSVGQAFQPDSAAAAHVQSGNSANNGSGAPGRTKCAGWATGNDSPSHIASGWKAMESLTYYPRPPSQHVSQIV